MGSRLEPMRNLSNVHREMSIRAIKFSPMSGNVAPCVGKFLVPLLCPWVHLSSEDFSLNYDESSRASLVGLERRDINLHYLLYAAWACCFNAAFLNEGVTPRWNVGGRYMHRSASQCAYVTIFKIFFLPITVKLRKLNRKGFSHIVQITITCNIYIAADDSLKRLDWRAAWIQPLKYHY